MTPDAARIVAEHSLAVFAAGAALQCETVRGARDDASAPQAEIPAAALRRVWLWALSEALPSFTAAGRAAGVSRKTIQRSAAAVEAWRDRDLSLRDQTDIAAGMVQAMCAVHAEGPTLLRLSSTAVCADRVEMTRRRAERPRRTRKLTESQRRMLRLADEAEAAGNPERAARFRMHAEPTRRQEIRARDVHRVRTHSPAI